MNTVLQEPVTLAFGSGLLHREIMRAGYSNWLENERVYVALFQDSSACVTTGRVTRSAGKGIRSSHGLESLVSAKGPIEYTTKIHRSLRFHGSSVKAGNMPWALTLWQQHVTAGPLASWLVSARRL